MNWEEELAVAREASQNAGEKLNRLLGRVHQITRKGKIDLVTEADLEAERTIVEAIRRRFPQDSILTEETGEHKALPERVWIVDPLDGTINFAHNLPFYAVCIGLQVEGRLVLGLVYNPCMDERFEAREGEGAFLNGASIRVSETKTLVESLVATGFPYSVHEDAPTVIQRLHKVVTCVQGVRRAGSAALDMCYVAAGRFDAYWEEGLKPWDTAAASVIAREAGGRLSDYGGQPYSPFVNTILVSNGLIHEAMLEALRLD